MHPIQSLLFRAAATDEVIPLSEPIRTSRGESINELPVPEGLRILVSASGYNRLVNHPFPSSLNLKALATGIRLSLAPMQKNSTLIAGLERALRAIWELLVSMLICGHFSV
jgi:hypothetical protein